jgi:hypothetical protein
MSKLANTWVGGRESRKQENIFKRKKDRLACEQISEVSMPFSLLIAATLRAYHLYIRAIALTPLQANPSFASSAAC